MAPRNNKHKSDGDSHYESAHEELPARNDTIGDLRSQLAKMNREMEKLRLNTTDLRDELRASKAEARSYNEELERSKSRTKVQESKSSKDPSTTNLSQKDELRAWKAKSRSLSKELEKSRSKVRELEAIIQRDTPAIEIGRDVRLRYLESHRRNTKSIYGMDVIKAGNRAAHRAKPIADAWLYTTKQRHDPPVFVDLYGITPEEMTTWKDIPEVVDVRGFYGTLKCEGRLSGHIHDLFQQFFTEIRDHSPEDFRRRFDEDKKLQQRYHELQDCYDEILYKFPLRAPTYWTEQASRSGSAFYHPTA
ncbi:hypothetical protein MMC14_009416 [Varicellaria rhodocarpa]|nr:hypothetical protein [Varicellaria rhodocarpa]